MTKFDQIKKQVQKLFKGAEGSHDWEHTKRVYKLAIHIGKIEKADMEIVKLAAILHDIGLTQGRTMGLRRKNHAKRGAKMARELLLKHKLESDIIEQVVHCIRCHRYREDGTPNTLEAKVLHDADKLDSSGAVGIGRAFLFAGDIGARLHNKEVDILKTKQYTREDTAWREYSVKMKHLKDRMLTREGKRLAKGRHEFMKQFFERMNKEIDGKI